MRIPVAVVVAGIVLCLPAVGGCAASEPPSPYLTAAIGENGPGTAPGPGIFPLVPATHAHVQLTCPLVSAVHYDAGAIPAVDRAYVCTTEPYLDAPDGTPQIVEYVDRVADADIAGLLEAYSVDDEAVPPGTACAAVAVDPMIVWLHHGDERITPVYAPKDECGNPQPDAETVYDDLELHRLLVAREKLRT
jgi:hypothetical protein